MKQTLIDSAVDQKKGEPIPRVKKLRDLYLQTLSSVDNEFPYWYTRTYMAMDNDIPVIRRATALKEAFAHLTPVIYPGELIVVGKAAYYRGSFPMPWLSEGYYMDHEDKLYQSALARGGTSADELSVIGAGGGNVTHDSGPVVSLAGKFGVRCEEVPAMLEIARLWVGRSVDDLGNKYEQMVPGYELKENLMRSLVCMFDSGYTLPQGREVINYYYPLQYGLAGLIHLAAKKKAEVAGLAGGDGSLGMNRLYNYQAMILVIEGIQAWISNYAAEAKRLEGAESDPQQKEEFHEMASCLEWISNEAPRTFREALQLCWIVHVAVLNEDAISGLSPGRLGQVLFPWFDNDIRLGHCNESDVSELLQCLRVKFTSLDCFASMGVIGGVLSGNTFNNLSLGGLTADGRSATNRLETLILEAGIGCITSQPTLSVLYDEKLPEEFLLKAIESVKTGTGYPAFMNNRIASEFLIKQYGAEGMSVEEARAVAIGGCLETSPCSWMPLDFAGKSVKIPGGSGQPTSVGVHFVSLPKILELTLFDGMDQRTGHRVFPSHNKKLDSYGELWEQFTHYVHDAFSILSKCNNIQHDIWRKNNMGIFHSLLKPDCLESGHLINELGYRYNATHNIETCGTINLVNSLAALKKLVFDEKTATLKQMKIALSENFGYQTAAESGSFSLIEQKKRKGGEIHASLHLLCLKTAKYGNDLPEVDGILQEWERWFCSRCADFESLNGHPYYPCQISVSTHAPMGAATLATPDGRLAGTTFADGSMSAYPGTDRNGPYALFESACCWDHSNSQNSQLNLKLHPTAVKGIEGSRKLLELTRAYMRRGGFHIQYNVVDSKILRDAQNHPKEYRNLMVRVAGFTQYWVEIGKPIQDEVIARTEYEGV